MSHTIPIYEVAEHVVDPAMNQRFFPVKAHAETYRAELINDGMTPGHPRKHYVPATREGLCWALNNLVTK